MYLSSVRIGNFRSCYETTVNFSPALTLLVGENNCGKSNVIDALRLATTPLDRKHARWFERDDLSRGREDQPVEINTHFSDLTDFQKGQYITALDLSSGEVEYATKFVPDSGDWKKSKLNHYAGKLKSAESEPEQRNKICHVYLPPLRDVHRELDSYDGYRISRIIELLSPKTDIDDLITTANSSMSSLDAHPVVDLFDQKLQKHMTPLTMPFREQTVKAGFQTELKLHKLIKNLRIKMSEVGYDLGSLSATGMGYANLVFIAMVIMELESAKDNELTVFLVEEPEAHLHPQLQIVLLDYLKQHAEDSMRLDDSDRPAGRIQVIATTHSPNLASVTTIENITVLSTKPISDDSETGETNSTVLTTKALAIKDLNLDADDIRKINQYLDVTRSSLLFARNVILVEGTAEAVLLPVLAKYSVFEGTEEANKAWTQKFLGVTVISVGSVDFAPYLKMLLTKNSEDIRLVDNLTVLTDGDPDLGQDADDVDEQTTNRSDRLNALAADLDSSEVMEVCQSEYTLEADLFTNSENFDVLKSAFDKQHSRSSRQWSDIIGNENPAEFFYLKLRHNKNYISKGEFAHDLAKSIQDGEPFLCPIYIQDAIKNSVGFEEEASDEN